jgi:hypothetical protein
MLEPASALYLARPRRGKFVFYIRVTHPKWMHGTVPGAAPFGFASSKGTGLECPSTAFIGSGTLPLAPCPGIVPSKAR